MRKIFSLVLVLMVTSSLLGCYEVNQDMRCLSEGPPSPCNDHVYPFPPISVTLAPDSPSGEVAPGERTLAVFTVNTSEPTEIYGLDLDVVDNYNDPIDYWLVDEVWIEDQDGNLVYEVYKPRYITKSYNFWGVHQLPAGKTNLVVKGHVTFGEPFDEEWDPRPEIQVQLYNVYAEKTLEDFVGLDGNVLIVKYTDQNKVHVGLEWDSPGGQLFEGLTYSLYKFSMWVDKGDVIFSNAVFEFTNFDGELQYCSLWEGNTLISINSKTYTYPQTSYIFFDENAESLPLMITTVHRTFNLLCQVQTNSDHQSVRVRFAGGYYQTGPSGMMTYINDGPWGNWFDFLLMDQLMVSLATDTPHVIVPGVNVTLMKFKMMTTVGEAKLYSLPFMFYNRPDGVYSNCHIEDAVTRETLNVGSSGYNPGDGNLYEIYFFGPSTGDYPGDSDNFTVVGTTWRTFQLNCDVALSSGTATTIQLENVSYYQVGTAYYDIKPDSYPLLETWIIQD